MKKKGIISIVDILWQIKDKKYMGEILEDILTYKELKDITERIQILRLLKQ
jgi:Trp operon repressor